MVIGITGGIASGKSFVSKYIEDKGYFVLDTDKLYKKLIMPGEVCYNALIKEFNYLNSDKTIDLVKLANVVYNDHDKLRLLNSIVHPLIYEETKKIINKHQDTIFLVVPLMFEAKFDTLCDKIICVYTSLDNQISRLMKRDNIDKDLALKKINSQMDTKERIKRSDYTIESCVNFNKTIENIENVLERI